MKRKLKEDVEDKFFVLDTKITKKQTQLQIPQYFEQKVSKRLSRVPFDPRFTLAAYYAYLIQFKRPLEDLELPFHWSDWMDMSTLEKVIYLSSTNITCDYFDHRQYQNITFTQKGKTSDTHKGAVDPREFCVNVPKNGSFELGYNITHSGGRMTKEKAIMAALSYVHTLFPNPESILFLTKDGSYHVRIARKKQSIVSGNEIGQFITQLRKKDKSINTLKAFQKLQKVHPAEKRNIFTDYEVRLKHEDFVIEPSLILLELHRKESERPLSRQEMNLQRALVTSLELKKDRPKYFYEAKIYDTSVGDHYDWRFFSGFLKNSQESVMVLHRLMRSWLSFTRKLGLNTWIAHGSLLSWHFNGLAFPWDDDIDVQMPVQDLLKLSGRFNQSIIVEDAEEGFGRFFLDCGTYIASREHGNGDNNIDARFIDIDTGLYIDITALAVSDEEAKNFKSLIPDKVKHLLANNKDINNYLQVYNCRNNHFASLEELSPLVRTLYDGELAYVPRNYPTILRKEYGEGVTLRLYKGKVYLGQLRIWVHKNPLTVFLRNPNEWDLHFKDKSHLGMKLLPPAKGDLSVNELNKLQNLSEDNLFRLLNHDDVFLQYQVSHGFTLFHEAEGMRLQMGKSTEAMMYRAPDLPPLYYEPFLFRMRKAYTTFEANVERYEKLTNKTQ
ncbi:hypothetical protein METBISCDRAFT_31826 [Metschnikowia bicuspidata]|uniref:LicD/FKTN/FKRP nucleotidyltransferase domain-containing protein n=1 Tax=Metschnikowia bicuspidata TaxID=27322 RepID=A0A4P9Z900_9ASCO|nr:hypothetical protein METBISCDRAFT_31826 [Metschnikowia bicuspidata]